MTAATLSIITETISYHTHKTRPGTYAKGIKRNSKW
jgi:hypothetical protein